ncbi:unnamed protein product [Oikopleura dioica]|uniref:Divalent-cation tolerance protein CutA n=1 Tax=Oikopleura dioica TaxID=34765 RepID=E4WZT1_OIKDI|nr:unnamed protein product [Oikopleura dioica]
MSSAAIMMITCPSIAVAKKLARSAVKSRLAACGNIIPGMTSIYEWKGEICEEEEAYLLLKTQKSMSEAVIKFVKENHPYDVPCIVSVPLDSGNPEFLKWVKDQTGEK